MSNFDKEFQKIIEELESEIASPKDLEIVKGKVYKLYKYIINNNNASIKILAQNQKEMREEIERIKRAILDIQEDIYEDSDEDFYDDDDDEEHQEDKMHDNDYEFEITCPYCNYEFIADTSCINKIQIPCPKCKKIIDLDWSSAEDEYEDDDDNDYSEKNDESVLVEEPKEDFKYIENIENNKKKSNNRVSATNKKIQTDNNKKSNNSNSTNNEDDM